MGASRDSEFVTALASESEHATSSSSPLLFARSESMMVEREVSGKCTTSIEEQIERSKTHWSKLVKLDSDEDEAAEVDNVEVFRTPLMHPTWNHFFQIPGEDAILELQVGEKFAEGGQAELYKAQVKWRNPNHNEDLKKGYEYVLKVFKKWTFLRHLQPQLPQGLLQEYVERIEHTELGKVPRTKVGKIMMKWGCQVMRGVLLEHGRFAFVMLKEMEDLRTYSDRYKPFSKDHAKHVVESMMYKVALGMDWLHSYNIVHRDVKAYNVLFFQDVRGMDWQCVVADYKCPIGVVGTGFVRAPEILQVCKDNVVCQCYLQKQRMFMAMG